MIPPTNMMQDDSSGKENKRETHDLPQSPTSNNNQESKVGWFSFRLLLSDFHVIPPEEHLNSLD